MKSVPVISSALLLAAAFTSQAGEKNTRPNILFAISDDQSYAHTSFAGCTFVKNPAFDRVAGEGIFFTNCFASSPGCAPSRSAIVTGRHHWQNEQSGQHASAWLKKYVPFVDLLDKSGYYTGRTGKGVGPFRYARSESDSLWRKEDAAGIARSNIQYQKGSEADERFAEGISTVNYFENFKYFMESREEGKPFFFWFGAQEPHRDYEEGSWQRNGKNLQNATVPAFLPDHEVIRGDLLDYAVEIEWFDLHLKRMLDYLEETGELDNTIVIFTADNGMPFPRAKANAYQYGVHVPLAIRYPKGFPGQRIVNGPVSFIDFAPTILDMAGASHNGMQPMTGKSMKRMLESDKPGDVSKTRQYVFSGRERHSSSRYLNWGYPQRAIHNGEYLLIWNQKPERWPAGAPQAIKPGTTDELLPLYGIDESGTHHSDWAFTDIDGSPAKSFIIENFQDKEIMPYFELAQGKRTEFELFHVVSDPFCIKNLFGQKEYLVVGDRLKNALLAELKKTKDPRVIGPDREIFDSYIRYSPMREFPKN